MMIRRLSLIASLFLLAGCHTYDESAAHHALYTQRRAEPSYTLLVAHDECTGCLDAYLVQGTLPVPTDLREALRHTVYTKPETVDLKMAGHFPFDLLSPDNLLVFGPSFQITGKVIGTYNDGNTEGTLPLFYVEQWSWSSAKR